jgi:branched-chain amino acid transport system permease protein
MRRLDTTRIGRVLRAIQQSDSLAESLGINFAIYKVTAFAIGAFFAGIAGAYLPAYLGVLYLQHFNVWQSIYPIVHIIVGGLGYLFGPVVGTGFVTFLFEFTRAAPEFQQLIYAIVLVFVILMLPHGLMGLGGRGRSWLSQLDQWFVGVSPTKREEADGSHRS